MIIDELWHDSNSDTTACFLDNLEYLLVAHTHHIPGVNLHNVVICQHAVTSSRRVLGYHGDQGRWRCATQVGIRAYGDIGARMQI